MNPKVYEVHLEMFEGPLDLLLFLIKKNDLDIQNIQIARITKEYLAYLDLMKELNLEIAGDFLVMAATLMQIKARSLLPAQEGVEAEEGDLESELKAKLQELERFRAASNFLSEKAAATGDIFYRGLPRFEERDKALDIRIFDLLTTLREVLDRGGLSTSVLAGEPFPIESRIEKIMKMLEASPYVVLRQIFEGETHRQGVITCFLALLELIKLQRVFARQESTFADILIYKKEAPAEQLPSVWPGAEPGDPTGPSDVAPGTAGEGSVPAEPGAGTEPAAERAEAQAAPAEAQAAPAEAQAAPAEAQAAPAEAQAAPAEAQAAPAQEPETEEPALEPSGDPEMEPACEPPLEPAEEPGLEPSEEPPLEPAPEDRSEEPSGWPQSDPVPETKQKESPE